MARKPNECPKCKIQGYKKELEDQPDGLVWSSNIGGDYRCGECGFEWDINEDFNCMTCGREVPGRFLVCSKACEKNIGSKSWWNHSQTINLYPPNIGVCHHSYALLEYLSKNYSIFIGDMESMIREYLQENPI